MATAADSFAAAAITVTAAVAANVPPTLAATVFHVGAGTAVVNATVQ